METDLARSLRTAKRKVQYDTQCKRVLGNKLVLAWILRRAVREFAGMPLEVIRRCIEAAEISTVEVAPGESGEGRITGQANEDAVPGEGTIYYDIRFQAVLPGNGENLVLLMNVEAQKKYRPGYEIVTRGIFYGARMLSSQLDTEFFIPDYNGLRKVCSIWICMNAPSGIGNAIAEYSIKKRDVVPGIADRPLAYDKLSVVVIALNEKMESEDTFLNFMNAILSPTKPYEEKKRILTERYHVPMDSEFGKELKIMCNLSDYVEEIGIKKGREEGKTEIIFAMFRENLSDEMVSRLSGYSMEEIRKLRRENAPEKKAR